MRSAIFIGVDGIIVNKTNACGLTATVSKVSSGALEFLPLYSVKFVKKFLEDAISPPHNFKIISTNCNVNEEEKLINEKESKNEINYESMKNKPKKVDTNENEGI